MTSHRRFTSLFASVALLASLAGCAATPTDPSAGKVADASEYEYVTPLGSNIPQRVRKGTAAKSASPTATMSGEDLNQRIRTAGGQAAVETGGSR